MNDLELRSVCDQTPEEKTIQDDEKLIRLFKCLKEINKPRVVVVIEGGMVANIYSNLPTASVEILDMDDSYDDVVQENKDALAEVEADESMIEIY